MKQELRISILTDNCAGSYTMAEHGLSFLVEYDGKSILFDTGQSDLFARNAERMNISLDNIDLIVLSHGHFDHGNGLDFLSGHSLLCHPGSFTDRYSKKDGRYIGLHLNRDQISGSFKLITSDKPYKISESIFFLGEIPRITDFESKDTTFILKDGTPDYVIDDSALAIIMHDELFIITGCGHSGIVNTLEYARKVSGVKELSGIIGGFHLKERNLQTNETIKYIRENNIRHVYPCHCTALPALTAFYENFGINEIHSGDILEF